MKRPTVLVYLCLALGLGELADAPFIDAFGFALLFAALYFLAAWVLNSGRRKAGAAFAGLLSLFEVLNYPSWKKHGAGEWVFTTTFALVALVTLLLCAWQLMRHRGAESSAEESAAEA